MSGRRRARWVAAWGAFALATPRTPRAQHAPRPALPGAVPGAVPGASPRAFPSDSAVRTLARRMIPRLARPDTNRAAVIGLLEADGTRRVVTVGGARFDGGTLFEVGSVTKIFTALLLADMALRGEVRLEQPVAELLPAGAMPAGSVPAGTRAPARGSPVTLASLATHTSGLPYMPANFRPRDRRDPFADYHTVDLYAFLGAYSPPRAVGVRAEYSNVGAALLGVALARRAGLPYDSLVALRLTGPLGLAATSAADPERLPPTLRARLATGYDEAGRALPPWHLGAFAGAGALRSTADDLLTFLAANVRPERAPVLARALRLAQAPRHRDPDGTATGLGWGVKRTADGRTLVAHGGRTGGFNSYVAFDPGQRVGVVVWSNSPADVPRLGLRLLRAE